MTDMIAIRPFRYATRALRAGDGFIAKGRRDARILVAIGKARVKRDPGKIEPPPAGLAKLIRRKHLEYPSNVTKAQIKKVPEISALRAEYQAATGKRAFHGWSADQLRAKIEEVRAS